MLDNGHRSVDSLGPEKDEESRGKRQCTKWGCEITKMDASEPWRGKRGRNRGEKTKREGAILFCPDLACNTLAGMVVNEEAAGVEQCQPYSYWSIAPSPDLRMRYDHVQAGHGSPRLSIHSPCTRKVLHNTTDSALSRFPSVRAKVGQACTECGIWLFVPLTSFIFSYRQTGTVHGITTSQ